ncbi:MAG: type II toxin-antitoxin system HicB family antitoxin [Ignavibacteriaceae bacterium]|jgi:predicted RNase H-like HicB family nuclease|nr:type II toxin-antitoxin system HicB family antitoxin [Ignavibacteriaceae bacterium]
MSYNLNVIVEKDEEGYYAYCPELEGCQTQGDTLDETMVNIKEAIDLYLETLSEEEKKEIIRNEIYITNYEVKVA